MLDAGSSPADKSLIEPIDSTGRRWRDASFAGARRCSCKAEATDTDTSESENEGSPRTSGWVREASSRELNTAWRENAGKKSQLGPPDTQLFASGLATLTSKRKSHPQWLTMKAEWEEKVRAQCQDPRDAERKAALASIQAATSGVGGS